MGWGLPAPGAPSSPLLPRWGNCRRSCRKPVPSDSCLQDNCRSICRKPVSSDSCSQDRCRSRRRKHVSSSCCGLLRPQGAPNTGRGARQPRGLPEKGVRRVRRRRGRGQHGHHLPVRGPLRRQEARLGQGWVGWPGLAKTCVSGRKGRLCNGGAAIRPPLQGSAFCSSWSRIDAAVYRRDGSLVWTISQTRRLSTWAYPWTRMLRNPMMRLCSGNWWAISGAVCARRARASPII